MTSYSKFINAIAAIAILLAFSACNNQSVNDQEEKMDSLEINDFKEFTVQHVDWVKNANIYEVNIRQYTKSGTIKEFEEHLPRLKEMGVDILWIMPIQPIGEKNRKGGLGSGYSIQDYKKVNPDFGTMDDFKALVAKAHEMDMYVILDWVANHTAWDHIWANEHPDFYTKDSLGNFMSPKDTDWSDVMDLNYDSQELRKEMVDALKFWVSETDIDGYRCDMAGMVPTGFWDNARKELDAIKPVFMLAEWESTEMHHKAFDMSYSWEFHHLMNDVAKGEKSVKDIDAYFEKDELTYPANAMRMYFTTNHDENAWQKTVYERLGDARKTMAVLSATVPGMPLIYSGQEAGLNKSLKFFEKDEIDWQAGEDLSGFYKTLNQLKKDHKALWNGNEGGKMIRIKTSDDEKIFAFSREKEGNTVYAVFNLSKDMQKVKLEVELIGTNYKDIFSENTLSDDEFEMKAWENRVFVKE
ncbi:MAG: alpha-amylase family glycosyl hydrolase [Bacteroidota bacterium]